MTRKYVLTINGYQNADGSALTPITDNSPLPVSPQANADGGASLSRTISASGTNATNVKNAAGTLYSIRAVNFNTSAARFVKLYNEAAAPTVGTDAVFDTIAIPAAVSASQPSEVIFSGPAVGIAMNTGIGFGITGALADSDTTAIGAGDVLLTIIYQ